MSGRTILATVAAALAASVIAAVPAIVVARLLDASGPLVVVSVWSALTAVAFLLAARLPRPASVVATVAGGVMAGVGALVVIADVVIIPLSAYLIWFDMVSAGGARGAVSFVFVMLVAAGSAAFGATITRRPLVATAAYVAWISFLAIPVVQRSELVVALAAGAVVVVLATATTGFTLRAGVQSALRALVLLGLAVTIGVGLGGVTSAEGSRIVDDVLSPGFRRAVVSVFPNFPIVYDIPGYGYRLTSENIGRSPVLSNRPLFRVSPVDDRSIYLRTEVFHTFTGSSWRVSAAMLDPAAFDPGSEGLSPGPAAEWSAADEDDRSPVIRTEISILTDFYPMVPHTLDTVAFSVSDRNALGFDRSDESVGYHLRDPLVYGESVTLLRTIGRRRVAPDVDPDTDANADADERQTYLQVPDTVSESIRALARELTGATAAESMVNTLRYLRSVSEYTLEPPQPRDPGRFVEAFLEEHNRGFCVHFATAFSVIARLQGIPTRYVTGFLVQPVGPEEFMAGPIEPVFVSGYSAHAWAEVWLPETGWRIVEATPPMQPEGYENTFFDRFGAIRNEGRTMSQLSEILRRDVTPPERPGMEFGLRDLPGLLAWLPISMLVLVLVVLVTRRRVGLSTRGRFLAHASRLAGRSARMGRPSPERTGWTGWSAGAGRHASRVAWLILAVAFGGRHPTRRDLTFIRRWRYRSTAERRSGARIGSERSGA